MSKFVIKLGLGLVFTTRGLPGTGTRWRSDNELKLDVEAGLLLFEGCLFSCLDEAAEFGYTHDVSYRIQD